MPQTRNMRESEIKNRIRAEYFSDFDWTRAIGDIDLSVYSQPALGAVQVPFLWAETKNGDRDIYASLVQLVLTIGKARTFEQEVPPYFLGAADSAKIAFVDYSKVMHIFSKTDFNWNVAPSDHSTREFRELYSLLHDELEREVVVFKFALDGRQLAKWIKKNFKEGHTSSQKMPVTKNNFTFVYYDWVKAVKETINVDWQALQCAGILDCDFFLADLMSRDGMSIKDSLKVVLERTKYKVRVKAEQEGIFGDAFSEFEFRDGQRAYRQFWNRYDRPPKPVYQRYILERRDLLVPQDIREVKGSYYTPEQWVRLSQEYLARVLGEGWQEEYYVWDCAAGSGNLLRGLTNKYNIYASTLDDSDVKIMHEAIDGGRLNLVKNNVFQFDFLNDGYKQSADGSWISDLENCEKIPESLRNIIKDPAKRCKLIIYINPPYAEAGNTFAKEGKKGVSNTTLVHRCHGDLCGDYGKRELFVQFFVRVFMEIPSCVLAEFSKLKILQAPYFREFREFFQHRLLGGFLVPAYTFDNVKGDFPIGFMVWSGTSTERFVSFVFDVYDASVSLCPQKRILCYDDKLNLNDWFRNSWNTGSNTIGYLVCNGNDFQHQNEITVLSRKSNETSTFFKPVNHDNLIKSCVYHCIRQVVKATWLNDRDQFLAPADTWATDVEFQVDCLIWSLFNNAVRENNGICHWIPFSEEEVNSPAPFNSRFMNDFLHGRIQRTPVTSQENTLFSEQEVEQVANVVPYNALSIEAKAVLDAGREIWRYYMTKPGINPNASFLDIRAFFQGYKTTAKGKRMMNSSSTDERYTGLLADLREKMKALEAHIEPKIYDHGFLLR